MTCPHCTTPDPRRLCCAAHKVERATRDDDRLIHQVADQYGHDIHDLRNGVAEIRRERRRAAGGEVAR